MSNLLTVTPTGETFQIDGMTNLLKNQLFLQFDKNRNKIIKDAMDNPTNFLNNRQTEIDRIVGELGTKAEGEFKDYINAGVPLAIAKQRVYDNALKRYEAELDAFSLKYPNELSYKNLYTGTTFIPGTARETIEAGRKSVQGLDE